MYYWLKQPYGYGVYVVCDYSDDVYHVCNGLPSLMKPKKHSFLKFNPYLELVNVTDITEYKKMSHESIEILYYSLIKG